jgi:nucleoside-diphosphate-sugar epimerase
MRVLVTGSSGHVGGAITSNLMSSGYDVVGVSRRSNTVQMLSQVQADIGNLSFPQTMESISPCDAVVHTAAAISNEPDDTAISLTNCLGTQQVLALAKRWQVKSFVYLSSVPIIGRPVHLPITEEHPLAPPTAYHASKLYGEYLVRLSGLPAATLRLTSPVGPGLAAGRIFSVFVHRALAGEPLLLAGQGTRQQNYVDVRDVAQAVEKCVRGGITGIYNIAGARAISNYNLAVACRDTLDSNSDIVLTGQPDKEEGVVWDVSITKAATAFGYAPCYSIEDSIRAVAAEFLG